MTASTVTNLSESLRRIYAERYFEVMQNVHTPYLEELEECPDEPTEGAGWFFPFFLDSPQNIGAPAEGGDIPSAKQRTEVQGQVNAIQLVGSFQISELLRQAGTARAGFNGGEIKRHMKECTTDLAKHTQRLLVGGHGTHRLAVVQTMNSTTTFTADVNNGGQGVLHLRNNMLIDFYDLDTAGAIQGAAGGKITSINWNTRLVTFTPLNATAAATHGVYLSGYYGIAPNGLRNLVDNATFSASLHGKSRATYDKLNANVIDPGTPTDLDEDVMRRMCDQIYHQTGREIDRIRANTGVINSYLNMLTPDRRYQVVNGQAPKWLTGYKTGDLVFTYDKATAVIRKDPDIPQREMYFLSLKDSFYKHTLKKMGWLDDGGGILKQTPAATNANAYATSWTATLMSLLNQSCCCPLANGVIRNVKDLGLAGDT